MNRGKYHRRAVTRDSESYLPAMCGRKSDRRACYYVIYDLSITQTVVSTYRRLLNQITTRLLVISVFIAYSSALRRNPPSVCPSVRLYLYVCLSRRNSLCIIWCFYSSVAKRCTKCHTSNCCIVAFAMLFLYLHHQCSSNRDDFRQELMGFEHARLTHNSDYKDKPIARCQRTDDT